MKMTSEEERAVILKQLKEIKPGVNYPAFAEVEEDGKTVRFLLQSYYVGMYAAIYFPGDSQPVQRGDHNNTSFVRGLVKDLKKAVERGARITLGTLRPIKTDIDT